MRTQTLQAPMTVVEFKGSVKVVAENGQTRMLKPGEVLPAGTVLQIDDKAELLLQPAVAVDTAAAPEGAPAGEPAAAPAVPGGGTTAEIAALQQALLQGIDPTQLEATAAGGAPAAGGGGGDGSGNGGFITVSRTGDATLAAAGYDTTYDASTLVAAASFTGETVDAAIPAPILAPDASELDEANLDAADQVDPDLTSGSGAGEADTLVTGNLNVDFGGGSGTVAFQPVANQPALTSGGQTIVWSLSDDGQTLVGSVGDQTIITLTINADGTYSVDLDGPLDGDGLQPAFGITATNSDGLATDSAIVVTIGDDEPTAVDDSNSVAEDADNLTITGTVLANDTQGADGATVTPQTIENELGSLVLNADGSYSFTLNNANPAVQALTDGESLTQTISYLLTDGDGDTSSANLTITITGTDDGVVVTDLTPAASGGEGVVDEDDLATGSDSSKESLSVDGDFTVSAPDGLSSITVGGTVITLASLQGVSADSPILVTTGLGNQLAITGFSNGVVSYTYTLLQS
ncbi:retention module-containing protein, partial [Pseudaeromonas sharmana]